VGEPSHQEAQDWAERMAKYLADTDGLPMIAGRILGWLTICDPPEQTAAQIAEAIGASRASLTTNLRLLTSIGFLTQVTKPGYRTVFYRVDDDAWARVGQRQIASMKALGQIIRDGMALVGQAPDRGARIRSANEGFTWMEKVLADAPPIPSPGQTTKER
jgi:hypothetical protein